MPTPFEIVILKLQSLGAFQFLFPFMLTAAIFYGLIRKSRLFGKAEENVAVNTIVSLVAAFMVWASPVILGINIEKSLSAFFLQAISMMMVIVVGLLITGMFLPEDLAASLGQKLFDKKGSGIVVIFGVLIAAGVLISSGLVNLIIPGGILLPSLGGPGGQGLSEETILTLIVLIILAVSVAAIVGFGGGKKS